MTHFSQSKQYSHRQLFRFMEQTICSLKTLIYTQKKGIVKKEFAERISLAVTEVNGCALCAYEHTKMALKAGVDQETINSLLSGSLEQAPQEEAKALLFAQYYANCNGKPENEAIEELEKEYGTEKAEGILAAIHLIMVGNVIGIASGAFVSRLKGKAKKESSLTYELGIIFCLIPYFLLSCITGTLKCYLTKRSSI